MLVKGRQHAFQSRVGTRLIGTGLDTFLCQFTDFPVLPIGEVPKLNCLTGIKVVLLDRIGGEQPIANDSRRVDINPFNAVCEHVIRMWAYEERRAQGVKVDPS